LKLTHIGGPTVLVEVDGWRLLTDPTFDPAGGHYDFGWGTSSDKLAGPALALGDLPPVDAVLLTHDHHGDNLDAAGRALLPDVPAVVTTVRGARRLGLAHAIGLRAGAATTLSAAGLPDLQVRATPARHGPPLTRPVVGDVVGFALCRAGQDEVFLWITGDTVLHRPLRAAAGAMRVDVALVHVGGVRFPITGPLRYTMTGSEAVQLCELLRPRVAVPVHYEGWAHFADGRAGLENALALAPADVRDRVRWLPLGTPVDLEAS
jgi:L-ascorbate metabolism protein UlaG (beta-lactamase superfamily)